MKEKLLDKDTIDAYHAYVQAEIRSDLNSIALGPGRLPASLARGLLISGFIFLAIGILLLALRMQFVYFWDWDVQFVGPFFIILFLLCLSGFTYLMIIATKRSNRFRRELYFHPLGDYGIAAVHKDDLMHEQELKHDLKSGTTPHKSVMPRSEAYSQMNIHKPDRHSGHHNQGYRHGPGDPQRHQDQRRGPRPDDQRKGPRPDDRRRGPPPDARRPPDDRRRPPDGYRRPHDDRHGPPPEGRRGPPPQGEYRRGPPPDDRRRPPDYQDSENYKRRPPPDRQIEPPAYEPRPSDEGRPRGVPHFRERSPDDDLGKIKLEDNKTSESEL